MLADEGLAAAIEGLAEGAAVPISVGSIDVDPVDRSVGEAAYAVVSEIVGVAAGLVRIEAMRTGGVLTLTVEAPSIPGDVVVELGDRVGAVDGTLAVHEAAPGRVQLIAEIPCAS